MSQFGVSEPITRRAHLLNTSTDVFLQESDKFHSLFHRVLSLSLDTTLPPHSSLALLSFVIAAFQSLEKPGIRKECAPLVSISIWHHLHSEAFRDKVLGRNMATRKAWRAAQKRYEAAEDSSKGKLRFDRSWLYTLMLDFIRRLNDVNKLPKNARYCERFLELLIDLLSQLPTRRYTNMLIKDLNLLAALRVSPMFADERAVLIRDQSVLLHQFTELAIDDQGGEPLNAKASYDAHCHTLENMQTVALRHFESTLKGLALDNYASLARRSVLEEHLTLLSDAGLQRFCSLLDLRTLYPEAAGITQDRRLYSEIILSAFDVPFNFQKLVSGLLTTPTEKDLYNRALSRTEEYDGSEPLAVSKLNLQYLNLGDFLWRSLSLYRSEVFFQIRSDIENAIKRSRPRGGTDREPFRYDGFSKMALPISKPAVVEIGQTHVGSDRPSFVRAEIILDVTHLKDNVRGDWDSLHSGDVVFLVALKANNDAPASTNQRAGSRSDQDVGVRYVRGAEIFQVRDGNGHPIRNMPTGQTNGHISRAPQRRVLLNLDPVAYKADLDRVASGKPDIYPTMDLIIRRNRRENNFKPMLTTMQSLAAADTNIPTWFRDSFLGYGDPKSSNHANLPDRLRFLDFRDTFLDWSHLASSFPNRTLAPAPELGSNFPPPYVLNPFGEASHMEPVGSKKRRREQMEDSDVASSPISVSSYRPPNTGPYPMDAPKLNSIRFTPAQTEAIVSGVQPGLSVVVGPPGTGKTDVAVQMINLLYHNFPKERILLVAHSNQALNQLFQKIADLDIDQRHLLRLGHGEEDLETDASYSKHGRVESFMDDRSIHLAEVDRLATSINIRGAHGNSCETADYFNKVYIQPAWSRFWDRAHASDASSESISDAFPFHEYFSNAPNQPLFSIDKSVEENIATAAGCAHHIARIFTELESIRPFELLRQPRDRANYLLTKEARIIAMTSTHAAMRRSEIASLGFHYDTLIMEEAAQITEIESFIPCALQNPDTKTGELALKRIVLVGDHLQNSPIIQNLAFRQYANFEQSLFLRLIRLGVPIVNLDQQGRCRPSIAELFQWRYPGLTNLPHLTQMPEFVRANAGLKYDYQFIDVPDYQGQGEREASPHFIQNLGEAEYTVALYQYMRLLGYPARSISILATYAGQKALIRDVLEHRCRGNRLFGLPKIVTTVDKYQGEQNDFILLSMTRTKSPGYLRDIRRLTVALSRARLGLYILGRADLFASSCIEMKPALDILFRRPQKLLVTTKEMYPTQRLLGDEVEGVEIEGVEHLGQYVFEMTQAKIKALGGKMEMLGNGEIEDQDVGHLEGDSADEDGDDPLHEHTAT